MTQTQPMQTAIEGWFTLDPENPALLGSQCTICKSYFFPKETHFCRNPQCTSGEFAEVELSRQGRVWSFTTNHYAPPAPYIAPDPFEPYTIAAVELEHEKMVVLGQVARGYNASHLRAGMPVKLILEPLYHNEEGPVFTWKWKPVSTNPSAG